MGKLLSLKMLVIAGYFATSWRGTSELLVSGIRAVVQSLGGVTICFCGDQ
jgi:hypothetical protein